MLSVFLVVGQVPVTCDLVVKTVANNLSKKLSLISDISIVMSKIGSVAPTVLHVLTTKMLSNMLVGANTTRSVSGAVIQGLKRGCMCVTLTLSALLLYTVNIFVSMTVVAMTPMTLRVRGGYTVPVKQLLIIVMNNKGYNGVVSPGPGAVVTIRGFGTRLCDAVCTGLVPTLVNLAFAIFMMTGVFPKRGRGGVNANRSVIVSSSRTSGGLPSFSADVVNPVIAVVLLTLHPLYKMAISPLVTLPIKKLIKVMYVRQVCMFQRDIRCKLSGVASMTVLLIKAKAVTKVVGTSSVGSIVVGLLSGDPLDRIFVTPVSNVLVSTTATSDATKTAVTSSSFTPAVLTAKIATL